MVEKNYPEYEKVEREVKEVEKKLSVVHVSVGDYRQYVDKTMNYYKLIDEVRDRSIDLKRYKKKSLFHFR